MAQVLIIEDEVIILMTAADVLKERGLDVIEATSADQGAALLESVAGDVAVIFSDIDTPGELDGLALAAMAKERWPDIPIVLTSGRVYPPAEALPPGTSFFPKPYDLRAVSELIVELVGKTVRARAGKNDHA